MCFHVKTLHILISEMCLRFFSPLQTIQAQKNEGDRMKTKLRRLEEENSRKDKQIEQLLDPSRVGIS